MNRSDVICWEEPRLTLIALFIHWMVRKVAEEHSLGATFDVLVVRANIVAVRVRLMHTRQPGCHGTLELKMTRVSRHLLPTTPNKMRRHQERVTGSQGGGRGRGGVCKSPDVRQLLAVCSKLGVCHWMTAVFSAKWLARRGFRHERI